MSDQTGTPVNEDTSAFEQYETETGVGSRIIHYPGQVVNEVANVTFPTKRQWAGSWIAVAGFTVTGATVIAAVDFLVARLVLIIN